MPDVSQTESFDEARARLPDVSPDVSVFWKPLRLLFQDGKTPNGAHFRSRPANRGSRTEPRRRWPRSAPCAKPLTLIAGQQGDRFTLQVDFHDAKRHLPVVSLKPAGSGLWSKPMLGSHIHDAGRSFP